MPDDLADKVGDAAVRDVTAYLLEGTKQQGGFLQ
jgi:hypothetical protein